MKKLMFAIVAIAAGAAMVDVTSANIVGYNQNSTGGALNFSGGAMFLPVNGDDYTILGDWLAKNMNANLDCIQLLRTSNATTEKSYTYVDRAFLLVEFELDPLDPDDMEYLDELEEEYAGWWLAGSWGMEGAEAGDKDWKCGESFLGLMPSKAESGSMVVWFPSSIPAAE